MNATKCWVGYWACLIIANTYNIAHERGWTLAWLVLAALFMLTDIIRKPR